MKLFSKKFLLPFLVLGIGLTVSYAIFVRAQTAAEPGYEDEEVAIHGITFPVPELGNCTSKDECRAYCNEPTHMDECIKFAKEHGLMNKDEADKSEKFRELLTSGGGPGGCTNPRDCQTFCSDVVNLEVCVKFAKEHGFKDQNVDQGEKILNYIKSGGQTPGGCTSKDACEKYCSDFAHAQECFEFAQKAGITQVQGGVPGKAEGRFAGGIPPGQFQKFLEAIKNGQTPGGCKSKEECETYCKDPAHREECLSFAEKAGFVSHDQAELGKSSGFAGPGGCNSPESCRDWCNAPEHHEECFKFAEEHGFISKDEAKHTKEGFVRLREGLENAPEEARACLKSVLGENILDDIQSGKLTPGPDIGERVKNCFEKFGHKADPGEAFKHTPPEVTACLKEKLGDQFEQISSGKTAPTPELGDTFRVCFQKVQFQGGFRGPGGPAGGQGGGPTPEMIQHFLRSAPPGIRVCLKEKLGDDFEKIQSGEQVQVDTSKLKSCFEQFRSQMQSGAGGGSEMNGPGGMIMNFDNMSAQVKDCLKASAGEDVFDKLKSGEISTSEIKEKMMACMQKFQGQFPSIRPPDGVPPAIGFPPAVVECANAVLGADGVVKLQSGQVTADQKSQIYACVQKASGYQQPSGTQQYPQQMPPPTGSSILDTFDNLLKAIFR